MVFIDTGVPVDDQEERMLLSDGNVMLRLTLHLMFMMRKVWQNSVGKYGIIDQNRKEYYQLDIK